MSVLPGVLQFQITCLPDGRWEEGGPASPRTCPFSVLFSVQSKVVQEEQDLPPGAIPVLLVLLHVKPVELVCNTLKLPGDLYLCSMLPLTFWRLLPKGQACRETGR